LSQATDEEIARVLEAYSRRLADLKGDPRFKYISVFKNAGAAAGQEAAHAYSQVAATPFVPRRVLHELRSARDYFQLKERCLFCDMVRQELAQKERIVEERGYPNLKLNYEDVAEFRYQPGKCQRPYRVVALRKNISKKVGSYELFELYCYFFYITTRTDLSAAGVVACANQRCDQENVIQQLKNGVNALRVPLYDLVSNWAYMVIASLAWTLKSWFALMMHRKSERSWYLRMEFRRFLHSIILIPCRVVRRARSITIRLIGYQPTLDRFFSAWNTIERSEFG
jgi:hypothetical protein